MRKVVPIGAVIAALVFVAAALAVTNTYTVTAKVTPAKAGTKKKPTPIQLNFNYTVGEASGLRPAVVTKYAIGFGGIVSDGKDFAKCTAAAINNANPPRNQVCPAGSAVGKGNVENQVGSTADPSSQPASLKCHLDLTIYNSGQGAAALYLFGSTSNPHGTCPTGVDQAIPATYTTGPDGGTSLVFTVPPALGHPLPGFDNAVTQVASSINKITKRVHGKTVAYYASKGGCKSHKRNVTVTFTTEAGQTTTTGTTVPCAP
jgi:hypothetical protein